MSNPTKTATLIGLLALSPIFSKAQTCQTTNTPVSTPASQFTIDNIKGIATDIKTGLMWKRCSEGQTWTGATCTGGGANYNWQKALKQAQVVNGSGFAGFTDWRLPNIKELRSIVERQCFSPSVNLKIFPNTISQRFWSSSPSAYLPGQGLAWYVYFNNGDDSIASRGNSSIIGYTYKVRLVRGGL